MRGRKAGFGTVCFGGEGTVRIGVTAGNGAEVFLMPLPVLVWVTKEAPSMKEGCNFSALTISYKAPLYDTSIPLPDWSRRPFSGTPDDIAGDIRNFAAIGVHELIFDCRGQSIAESVERLQWFATDVTPLVDA